MEFMYRKILNNGPIRTTVTGKGIGWSFGLPGCRYGISADGRSYLAFGIPGTGLYYRHYFKTIRELFKSIS